MEIKTTDIDSTQMVMLLQIQQSMSDGFTNLREDVTDELNSIKANISSINVDLAKIKSTLDDDHKKLCGNGKKGLIDRVENIETAISSGGLIWKAIVSFIAWVIATGIAIYAAVIK